MVEEIFGPVVTVFVYEDNREAEALDQLDAAAPYGLTGAVFAQDRRHIRRLADRLRFTAGNFYINDKPTGAVVGQQPFGGSRASGTNDKAGSAQNCCDGSRPAPSRRRSCPPPTIAIRSWSSPRPAFDRGLSRPRCPAPAERSAPADEC